MTLEDRFWSRVKKSDGCWLWQGPFNNKGYGRLLVEGKMALAHRLSLQLNLGRPLRGHALHKCDNPPCVNPAHLEEGSHSKNMRDSYERGRVPWQVLKKACKRGHPLSGENLYRVGTTQERRCRICTREAWRRSYFKSIRPRFVAEGKIISAAPLERRHKDAANQKTQATPPTSGAACK